MGVVHTTFLVKLEVVIIVLSTFITLFGRLVISHWIGGTLDKPTGDTVAACQAKECWRETVNSLCQTLKSRLVSEESQLWFFRFCGFQTLQ